MRTLKIADLERSSQRKGKPKVNWGKMLKNSLALAGIVGAAWYLATVPNMCMEENLQRKMRVERALIRIEAMQEEQKSGKADETR